MDVTCSRMDQEGYEGLAAGSEGPKHLDDRCLEREARTCAYSSFCGFKHSRFFPPLHQGTQEDQPFTQEDRCDGQPQRPPQQDREGGVRRQMVQLPIPASLELRT